MNCGFRIVNCEFLPSRSFSKFLDATGREIRNSKFALQVSGSDDIGLRRRRICLKRISRYVIQDAAAVIASYDFGAAADFRHDLWPQRHEACSTRSVASFSDSDSVPYPGADSGV